MTYIFIHKPNDCARALCMRLRVVIAGVNTSS
jgi:hypothetical protein